ncbi:MAG: hypothetical protein J6U54_05235 [Clostridiales bacterium]|nr:hypothetical protein [Clostridiales bacterium]
MAAITFDKTKNVGKVASKVVEGVFDIGLGGLFWGVGAAATQFAPPIVRVCAKVAYGALGAACGKVISEMVCDTFKIEDKVNQALGIEVEEEPVEIEAE